MHCYAVVAISVLYTLTPFSANAQQSAVLPGAQVRVTLTDAPRTEGTLTLVSRDSVVVATAPSVRSTIRNANIKRIEQFEGHSHAAGAVRGALVMSVVGAVIGALPTPPNQKDWCGTRTDCHPPTRLQSTILSTYAFGLLGEWIGGFVGRDRWRRVEVRESLPITPTPAARVRAPALDPGIRVQVTAPGIVTDALEGTVIRSTTDSLSLATPKGIRFDIATSAITEVRRPIRSSSAGAAAGAGWGAAIYVPIAPFGAMDAKGSQVIPAMLATSATGTGLGALIGALHGKEKWEVIHP